MAPACALNLPAPATAKWRMEPLVGRGVLLPALRASEFGARPPPTLSLLRHTPARGPGDLLARAYAIGKRVVHESISTIRFDP